MGWSATAEATSGSQENIRRLDTGELDFALSNAAITYFAVRGTEGWDRAYDMRTVMTLAPNVALWITAADSGVQTIADLRDERVGGGGALRPGGQGRGGGGSGGVGHCSSVRAGTGVGLAAGWACPAAAFWPLSQAST